jgi:hypothetical protein
MTTKKTKATILRKLTPEESSEYHICQAYLAICEKYFHAHYVDRSYRPVLKIRRVMRCIERECTSGMPWSTYSEDDSEEEILKKDFFADAHAMDAAKKINEASRKKRRKEEEEE